MNNGLDESNQVEAMASLAARDSLIDYCILTQNDYEPNWHHEVMAKELEALERGEIARLMLFMPPRHGKSEIASIKFPAWILGRDEKRKVIACSYSAELAEEFGRQARNQVTSEEHTAIFPNCILDQGTKRVSKWNVSKRGGYIGVGVGGSITGKGADFLLIDDPVKNREEAESQTVRNGLFSWYTSTARTRLEGKGKIVVVQTRWHDDDLSGRILEMEGEVGHYYSKPLGRWVKGEPPADEKKAKRGIWKVVRLPAIATEDERYRKIGEPLWQKKYSLEDLEEIKNAIGLRDWSALYQQDPTIEEGLDFKKDWFKYWDRLPANLSYVTSVDLAISKKRRADFSVVITTGMDANGKIYIVEYKQWKADPSEIIDEIYRQASLYGSLVTIEATGFQQAIVHYIKEEGKKRNKYIHFEQIHSQGDKEGRIRATLMPLYSNGMIYHPRNGVQELEDELQRFPVGKHDDIIDALSQGVTRLNKPKDKKTYNFNKLAIQYDRGGRPIFHRRGGATGMFGTFR